MSTKKSQGKKTIVTRKADSGLKKERIRPTSTTRQRTQKTSGKMELLFGWTQYKVMLIGIGLIAVGMLLMIGGSMPSPDVWDDGLIYSFRRTVLAPFLILVGLLVEVYAIFKD